METHQKPIIYGYARVSTKKQSLKMQLEELNKFGCIQIVQEKVSALAARPQFDGLLCSLNKGDTLLVWKLGPMLDLIKIRCKRGEFRLPDREHKYTYDTGKNDADVILHYGRV